MTDLEIARDLRNAAAYLRTHGWVQGSYGADGGSRCAAGALYSVTRDEIHNFLTPQVRALGFASTWHEHRMGVPALGDWNDTSGRTLDEVLDRLESTALGLEVRALAADKPAEELVAVGV
jgi:hypothetical protein